MRFRTPIKDTRDTAFLFFSVGIGICVGAQALLLAVIGTTFALLVTLYLSFTRFGDRIEADGVLRFALRAEPAAEQRLQRVLKHYCRRATLLHVRAGAASGESDYAYRLSLHDADLCSALVQDLTAIPGLRGTNLLLQTEDEEL
ncbi:MAG: hypothetical protein JNM84_06560 [Planctomycetes bacterium]|nr:hypothetical protein [Planctomycetota bacterium]